MDPSGASGLDRDLRTFFTLSGVGLLQLEPATGRILAANQALCEMLGRPVEAVVGERFDELARGDPRAGDPAALDELYTGARNELSLETRLLRADGGSLWVHLSAMTIADELGHVLRVCAVVSDISDSKREQQRLERLHEISTALVESRQGADALLENILDAAIELSDMDAGEIRLLDPGRGEGRELRVRVRRGCRDPAAASAEAPAVLCRTLDTLAQRALDRRERVVIEDVTGESADLFASPADRDALQVAGLRAAHCTPMRTRRGDPVGVLAVYGPRPGPPRANALRHIDMLSRFAVDLLERHRAEQQLLRAARDKDEFVATLSHELRNPLAPIRHAVRIGQTAHASEQQRQWAFDVIGRQARHMAGLLDDLLDASRIARGVVELQRQPVQLHQVLHSALELAQPLLDEKRITVSLHLPDEGCCLRGDPLRLTQVFGNLLTNAAKYTDGGGSVRVEARIDPAAASVDVLVSDTGIGIDAETLPRVFDLFSQSAAARARSNGLGIGLALVRGIVELHGGRVFAHSPGRGAGSTFTVRLPLEQAGTAMEGVADQPRAPVRAPLRVVVADDNEDAAASAAMLLRLGGHEVQVANDGHAALRLVTESRPDVALLDIAMPGMSGNDVAAAIRAEPWGRHITLVAVTGWGRIEDQERARAAGFDDHLVKPVDPESLERCVTRGSRVNY